MKDPNHIAVKYYKDYHSGSAKTLKSIQITLAARLEKFNLETVNKLTITDELDLSSIGEKKVPCCQSFQTTIRHSTSWYRSSIPSYFNSCIWLADHKYHGRLPVHDSFLDDEFANVSLPDDFDKLLSVMRSREVSVSIIYRIWRS